MKKQEITSNSYFEAKNVQISLKTSTAPSGAPDVMLARLPEFFRSFLSDGLLPDLVYVLELKTV